MTDDDRTQPLNTPMARAFRLTALAEGVSYLVLLAAVVLYRVLDGPDLISAIGPIHGMLFLAFGVIVLKIRPETGWGAGRTLGVLLLASVPFGAFFTDRHLQVPAPAAAADDPKGL